MRSLLFPSSRGPRHNTFAGAHCRVECGILCDVGSRVNLFHFPFCRVRMQRFWRVRLASKKASLFTGPLNPRSLSPNRIQRPRVLQNFVAPSPVSLVACPSGHLPLLIRSLILPTTQSFLPLLALSMFHPEDWLRDWARVGQSRPQAH